MGPTTSTPDSEEIQQFVYCHHHETPLNVGKSAIGAIKEAVQSCPPESRKIQPLILAKPAQDKTAKMDGTVKKQNWKILV